MEIVEISRQTMFVCDGCGKVHELIIREWENGKLMFEHTDRRIKGSPFRVASLPGSKFCDFMCAMRAIFNPDAVDEDN